MSIKVMISIWYTEFTDLPTGELAEDGRQKMAKASSCKAVLLAIADQGNDLGEGSFPGFTRLELKTGLSRQGIADVQKALKYNGLLSVADEKSKFNTNDYKINLECFPGGLENIGEKLLVKPLDQSSHLTSVGQATLPEVVKPLDLKHTVTIQQTSNGDLSEKDLEQVNAKVDAILDMAKTAKYQYREKFPPNLTPLVDCYVEVTGQTPSKRTLFDWIGSFGEMYDEGITPEHLRAAYKHATRPDGGFLVSRPGSLTNTAAAIKAQGGRKTDEQRPEYKPYVAEEIKAVPNPLRKPRL